MRGACRPQALRRELLDLQGVAKPLAGPRHQIEQLGVAPGLVHRGLHLAAPEVHDPEVQAELALAERQGEGHERALDDEVHAEPGAQRLQRLRNPGSGLGARQRHSGVRHLLPRDHPQAGPCRQIRPDHVGQCGTEPLEEPVARAVAEGQHGDRAAPRPRSRLVAPGSRDRPVAPGREHRQGRSERQGAHQQGRHGPGSPAAGRSLDRSAGRGARGGDRLRGEDLLRRVVLRRALRRAGGFGRLGLRGLHLDHLEGFRRKGVPLAGHGQDVAVLPGPLSERLTQGGDVLGEVRLGDETVRPHPLDQPPLLHHLAVPVDQGQEDGESLGRDGDRLAITQQEAPDRIDDVPVETVKALFGRNWSDAHFSYYMPALPPATTFSEEGNPTRSFSLSRFFETIVRLF